MRIDKRIVESRTPSWKNEGGVFALQIAGLIVAGWFFREALNPDGVAYLQIASHYGQGRLGLAISGHWGPALSWLMTPMLMGGVPPLATARAVMALSAIIFLLGCRRIFCQAKLGGLHYWGLYTMAMLSIPWSVEMITPDLLLAGVILFAFAEMVDSRWCVRPGMAFASGVLWGLAYLVKAVGLPLGILTCLGMAVLWRRKNPGAQSEIARGAGLTLAGLLLVAGPWVAVLSWHYGKLTVSTSASHNHALVGPSVATAVHLLDEGFRKPEPGRITTWEDPSLPYPDWSPWKSWGNVEHQIEVILHNTPIVLYILTRISLAFPIVVAAVLARRGKFQTNPDDGVRRIWFLLPVAALGVIYLPNYLMPEELRYFYAAAPLLFVGGAALLLWEWSRRRSWKHRYGAWLLAGSLLFPAFARFAFYSGQSWLPGGCAEVLAQRMSRAGLAGPLAGNGWFAGGRAGLYTAFFLGQPWLGDEMTPSAADYERSGASLIVVNRRSAVAQELAEDGSFRNLDGLLFSEWESRHFPLQVFGRK
ncbi:MAG TPA: hypothetical protein VMR33_21720 [Candidatus Baltobacteraceae bacterium]|nr:hypothetical protein [Candidatus Baltobacteraceae bacterium]